jgi:hypothetical protein
MKIRLALALVAILALALPGLAQRSGESRGAEVQRPPQPVHNNPRANQGHIPAPPVKREPAAGPDAERRGESWVNNTPHVANDHWYGHDRPNDQRFHLDHPYEHGHFEHFGPSYRYHIRRFDPGLRRFWLPGGFFFEIAAWDWPLAMDWCWDCGGEDFVIYEDPDHPGWYLLYNIHTGVYVHVQYMGA